MADQPAAPSTPQPSAPGPVVRPTRGPSQIPPASSHLGTPAPAASSASPPAAAPAPSAPGTAEPAAAAKPEGTPADPALTSRLAALAKGQRALEVERKKFETEQAAVKEAAAKWTALQEAKTSKGRLAALEALFEADEIEGDLYTELTERIYAKGQSGTGAGLTKEDADKLVEAKLAAARKADEEARAKAESEAKAKELEETSRVETGFLAHINEAFVESKAQFPALAAILEDFPGAVTGKDILDFTRSHFGEHMKAGKGGDTYVAPTPQDIFAHFEAKLTKRFRPTEAEAPARVPPTVTSTWRSGATPTPAKKGTLAEEWEKAKREAGIVPGAP